MSSRCATTVSTPPAITASAPQAQSKSSAARRSCWVRTRTTTPAARCPSASTIAAQASRFLDVGRRQGSVIFDIALLITAKAIWDVAETHYGFERFLAESYAAHRAGKLFKEPPHRRREAGPGSNSALPDLDYAREHERRRLLQRMQQAVSFISAPLGITASVVDVSIDGKHIDTMRARQPGGSDIHEWLQAFRQGKVGSSRFQ